MNDFAYIVSRCLPCHALLASDPPFFLNAEGLNLAAVDALTGIISLVLFSFYLYCVLPSLGNS